MVRNRRPPPEGGPSIEQVKEIEKMLVDQGKIIEAGYAGYRMMIYPQAMPDIQIRETHQAFFAGANHLFASIMSILEPGAEPTENDMKRLSMIHAELTDYERRFKLKHGID